MTVAVIIMLPHGSQQVSTLQGNEGIYVFVGLILSFVVLYIFSILMEKLFYRSLLKRYKKGLIK